MIGFLDFSTSLCELWSLCFYLVVQILLRRNRPSVLSVKRQYHWALSRTFPLLPTFKNDADNLIGLIQIMHKTCIKHQRPTLWYSCPHNSPENTSDNSNFYRCLHLKKPSELCSLIYPFEKMNVYDWLPRDVMSCVSCATPICWQHESTIHEQDRSQKSAIKVRESLMLDCFYRYRHITTGWDTIRM